MKILVINTGSSSIKYRLFNMGDRKVLASGLAEKIGEEKSSLTHEVISEKKGCLKNVEKDKIADHHEGLTRIVDLLMDKEYGVITDKNEITAIGHRVVHGGEDFQSSIIIDEHFS